MYMRFCILYCRSEARESMSRQAEDFEYFSVKQTESVDTLFLLNLSYNKVGIYPVENALTIVGNPV